MELAQLVQTAGANMGLDVVISHTPNPRVELESHYFNAKHTKLLELGLQPHLLSESLVDSMLNIALRFRDRGDLSTMQPRVNWRSTHNSLDEKVSQPTAETAPKTFAGQPFGTNGHSKSLIFQK